MKASVLPGLSSYPPLCCRIAMPVLEQVFSPSWVKQSRSAWRAIAQKFGLAFVRGPRLRYVQGDRLTGMVGDRRVVVSAGQDEGIQKVVIKCASPFFSEAQRWHQRPDKSRINCTRQRPGKVSLRRGRDGSDHLTIRKSGDLSHASKNSASP